MPKPQVQIEQGANTSGMALHSQILLDFEGERKEKVRKKEDRKGRIRKRNVRGMFASRNKAMKKIIETELLLKNMNVLYYYINYHNKLYPYI